MHGRVSKKSAPMTLEIWIAHYRPLQQQINMKLSISNKYLINNKWRNELRYFTILFKFTFKCVGLKKKKVYDKKKSYQAIHVPIHIHVSGGTFLFNSDLYSFYSGWSVQDGWKFVDSCLNVSATTGSFWKAAEIPSFIWES